MRFYLFILILILMLPSPSMAQDTPVVEFFGGYSIARIDSGADMSSGSGGDILGRSLMSTPGAFGNSRVNLHGWNASSTTYFRRRLGMTADFSGHYGSPAGLETPTYSFLFGPQYRLRAGRLAPFVRSLFGTARTKVSSGGELFNQRAFALTAGGGLDVGVNRRLAIRVLQAELLLTRFGGRSQHNFRYSAGVVLRFGQK